MEDDTSPTGITLTANQDTVAKNMQTAPAVTGCTRYAAKKTVAAGADRDTAVEGTYNDHVNGLARFCTGMAKSRSTKGWMFVIHRLKKPNKTINYTELLRWRGTQ